MRPSVMIANPRVPPPGWPRANVTPLHHRQTAIAAG